MDNQNFWLKIWAHSLGIDHFIFFELLYFIFAIFLIYILMIGPARLLFFYLDRKMTAIFQARVGPSYCGPFGLFQSFANSLKLLQKYSEKPKPLKDHGWLLIHTMILYSAVAVVPLGSTAFMLNTEMSSFFPFFVALGLSLCKIFLGLFQSSMVAWLSAIRITSQVFSAIFPALISFLCVGVRKGSFQWDLLAEVQGFFPWQWTVFSNPFSTIAFLIFLVSGLILLMISPFNSCLSSLDIHGGVHSHLSGWKFLLFQMNEFYSFFLWCLITVIIFLGAWSLPLFLVDYLNTTSSFRLLGFLEFVWLLLKTFFLMLIVTWFTRAHPRYRVDQITEFSWKILSPFALIALVGMSLSF